MFQETVKKLFGKDAHVFPLGHNPLSLLSSLPTAVTAEVPAKPESGKREQGSFGKIKIANLLAVGRQGMLMRLESSVFQNPLLHLEYDVVLLSRESKFDTRLLHMFGNSHALVLQGNVFKLVCSDAMGRSAETYGALPESESFFDKWLSIDVLIENSKVCGSLMVCFI